MEPKEIKENLRNQMSKVRTFIYGSESNLFGLPEVNFNNACNLACSYCSPQYSSTWAQEVEREGGYPTLPDPDNLDLITYIFFFAANCFISSNTFCAVDGSTNTNSTPPR